MDAIIAMAGIENMNTDPKNLLETKPDLETPIIEKAARHALGKLETAMHVKDYKAAIELLVADLLKAARGIENENIRFRSGFSRIAASIGNGSAASPSASVEFLTDSLANEVKTYCEHLRSQIQKHTDDKNAERKSDKSNCCWASVSVEGGGRAFGTCYYKCERCGQPCDLFKPDVVAETVKERGKVYGDPFQSHGNIGKAWTGLIQQHYGMTLSHDLPASLVALMMVQFKAQRSARVFHADNFVDLEACARFAAEFQKAEELKK